MTKQCSERVWDNWGAHPCTRLGKVERDGKPFCKQHDPEFVKVRRAARDAEQKARWDAEAQARMKAYDRQQRMEAFFANAAAKTKQHNEHRSCDCDLCKLWREFVRPV